MNLKTKIKIKMFIFDLIFEICVDSIIFAIAYFSNRILEVLAFYLTWNIFYRFFPKTFHYKMKTPFQNVIGCAICSCICYIVYMRLMLPIHISIFSSVLYGMLFHYVLYKIQDYLDYVNGKFKAKIDIYSMTEDELRNYAKSKGISEMIIDTLVLKVINNYRWVDIRKERNYSRTAIDYHKKVLQEKLNIKL